MREKIEILWTLKSSPSRALNTLDMVKNNNRLQINAEFKEKLRFLAEEKLIDIRPIQGMGTHYLITKKGNDLIWNGQTWQQIFNLIRLVHPEKYTGTEIVRIIRKPEDEVYKGIEYLRNNRKYIDAYDENKERFWLLSEKGENQYIEKNKINSPQIPTEHFLSADGHSKNKNKKLDTAIVLFILSIVVAFALSPHFSDFLYPPVPEIHVTDLNAQNGIVEGNKFFYSYEPRSIPLNGTKNETFTMKVSNTGKANAHDFWIIIDSKPDGSWFNFGSSATIQEGVRIPCQQKSSYCTIGLLPKESSYTIVEYNVVFDHKLYQEIVDISPKLFINYGFDEGDEKTIEVQLKI